MKIISSLLILGMMVAANSCQDGKRAEKKTDIDKDTATYWVNSLKKECTAGAGKMHCLMISKNENLENASWEFFYAPIEGFSFKPGYFQQIKVKETQLGPKNVPADASSIKYRLIETLKEQKDERFGLNDIWVVEKIKETLLAERAEHPRLEINLSKMKVYGTDGCNEFMGDITKFTAEKISFGKIGLTRKMCADMKTTSAFNKAFRSVKSFQRENLSLKLYDAEGGEVLQLKKVD